MVRLEDLDARALADMTQRCYLGPVLVHAENGFVYQVFFAEVLRIQQELKFNLERGEKCFAEPGLIVLEEVTLENIKDAIKQLGKGRFFDVLKPVAE